MAVPATPSVARDACARQTRGCSCIPRPPPSSVTRSSRDAVQWQRHRRGPVGHKNQTPLLPRHRWKPSPCATCATPIKPASVQQLDAPRRVPHVTSLPSPTIQREAIPAPPSIPPPPSPTRSHSLADTPPPPSPATSAAASARRPPQRPCPCWRPERASPAPAARRAPPPHHVEAPPNFALCVPAHQVGPRGRVLGGVIKHDEALHAGALDEQLDVLGGPAPRRPLPRIVLADGATEDDAPAAGQHPQRRVEQRPADVVKVNVNAGGARRRERRRERRHRPAGGLVVDDRVDAERIAHVRALGGAARDANDAAAEDVFGNARDDRARRARGGRHEHRLPAAARREADAEEAKVGRQPRHAERAERERGGQVAGEPRQRLHIADRRRRKLAHAKRAGHEIADRRDGRAAAVVRGGRRRRRRVDGEDLPNGARAHDRPEFDGRDVAPRRRHPPTHRGVNG
ncbi:hypothetical protein BU14_0183s0014 [Porphyra umbilicalis]|uniref:Uncharacterized protein n=1 Tax=Porphyra umbilicalis TaxID=2786 RepID=A0A1X6P6V8_PORUM|nr:hypothetical protein BU14_0183s0014 [Porphyra umbilicalis]|eukprot:OSX76622.1 hypothetical protein BU14_0183s0014 [Porphyra umbilicalis]